MTCLLVASVVFSSSAVLLFAAQDHLSTLARPCTACLTLTCGFLFFPFCGFPLGCDSSFFCSAASFPVASLHTLGLADLVYHRFSHLRYLTLHTHRISVYLMMGVKLVSLGSGGSKHLACAVGHGPNFVHSHIISNLQLLPLRAAESPFQTPRHHK